MPKAVFGNILLLSLAVHIAGEEVAGISYTASKGAVKALTIASASRLGASNIRVNAVIPGPILTPMAHEIADQEKLDHLASLNALKKLGTPEDIAYTSLFLASDECKFITGTEIVVDGGWKIHKKM